MCEWDTTCHEPVIGQAFDPDIQVWLWVCPDHFEEAEALGFDAASSADIDGEPEWISRYV